MCSCYMFIYLELMWEFAGGHEIENIVWRNGSNEEGNEYLVSSNMTVEMSVGNVAVSAESGAFLLSTW